MKIGESRGLAEADEGVSREAAEDGGDEFGGEGAEETYAWVFRLVVSWRFVVGGLGVRDSLLRTNFLDFGHTKWPLTTRGVGSRLWCCISARFVALGSWW